MSPIALSFIAFACIFGSPARRTLSRPTSDFHVTASRSTEDVMSSTAARSLKDFRKFFGQMHGNCRRIDSNRQTFAGLPCIWNRYLGIVNAGAVRWIVPSRLLRFSAGSSVAAPLNRRGAGASGTRSQHAAEDVKQNRRRSRQGRDDRGQS